MTSILQSKNLKTRILLGYGVPIGVLVLFGIVSGVAVKQLNDTAADLERANSVVDNVRDSVIHTSRLIRSVRGAGLFPKEEHYRDSYNTGVERLEETIAKMQGGELIRDPQQKESWNKLVKEIEERKAESDQVMALIKSGQAAKAIPLIGAIEMGSFDKTKDAMLKRQDEIISNLVAKEHFWSNLTYALIIIGLFGGTAVSLVLGNMIAGSIAKDVKMAVAEVSAASNEIAATMEQQERTASLQAASVSETTTTMDELGASSQQSQEQAEAAAQAAQEVLVLADQGNNSVEETVASMIDLKNKVAAIADQIVRLSEQTNQIGNISEVVSDLS